MKRGFSLLELMVVVAIAPIVIAATGAFYLEARIAAARTEAELMMTRQASLALEWMARDARGAGEIRADAAGATMVRGEDRVRWEIGPAGLVRRSGDRSQLLARRATRLTTTPIEGGTRFELVSERVLIKGRRARVIRSIFSGGRR